jgi:hypothetical protein
MKDMSYRDKMVILAISIVVILLVGFFALIRPAYNKLVADTNTYNTVKTEWDGIEQKINAIPTLKDTITDSYNESKKLAEQFVNEAFPETYNMEHSSYTIDQYLQTAIDESELSVKSYSQSDPASMVVDYKFHVPQVVSYPLLESADINGNYAKDVADLLLTSATLATTDKATMLGTNISLEVEGTREALMAFLDKINEDENALVISDVTIVDYQFNGGREVTSVGEDGQEIVTIDQNKEGTSRMSLNLTMFNAKEIDKPDLGD